MLNQVILVGRSTQLKKVKGKVVSLRLNIKRVESEEVDKPLVKIPESLSTTVTEYLKEDMVIGIKARITTEVKGKYGTVMSIVAEKLTFINQTEE